MRIPDLLVLFRHLGVEKNVLIEVKTSKREQLAIRSEDLASMQEYAKRLSFPLLLAWKPRRLGLWLLVDPVHTVTKGGKSILTLDAAIKNNLLGTVAGDFMVVPKPGAGLFIDLEIRETYSKSESGFKAMMQVLNAEYRSGCGEPSPKVPWSISAMIFANMESHTCVLDNAIQQSFVARSQAMSAQQILRTAVAFQLNDQDPVRWLHVAKKLEHVLQKKTLEHELGSHIGAFVQYLFQQHPKNWPSHLPEEWNYLPDDSTIG
ncbi:hypothetical protein Rcae01_00382 [Novipirellula caenicola]|uniref:Uncharacterized protein n=2 Tax=Novipirellula caenicola TaxID=1536901 RepID=A0ABP9VIA9_9BACT